MNLKKAFFFCVSFIFSAVIYAQVFTEEVSSLNEMVRISGGSFMMGNENGSGDESPVHEVLLPSFEIGRYEVTQELYEQVMGENPSSDENGGIFPVVDVSWYDAIYFCNKLSLLSGYDPCYSVKGETDPSKWNYKPHTSSYIYDIVCNFNADGFRLPTEAEWEYASTRKGSSASNEKENAVGYKTLRKVVPVHEDFIFEGIAWYYGNSYGCTHPVGQLNADSAGLYDMIGNVDEWCWDWYAENYYSVSDKIFPRGPESAPLSTMNEKKEGYRIYRGGGVYSSKDELSYTYRAGCRPHASQENLGFRLARTVKLEK